MFNVNLPTFLGLRSDFGGGMTAGNNSNEVTAKELLDALMGGSGGVGSAYAASRGGLPYALKDNLRTNAPMLLTSMVVIPMAFKVGTKLLRKPILTPTNRLLMSAGLSGVKV